jgi:hypothetical protein
MEEKRADAQANVSQVVTDAASPEPVSVSARVESLEQRASIDDDKTLPLNWSENWKGLTVFTLSSLSFIV